MTNTVEAHIFNSNSHWGTSRFDKGSLTHRAKKVHFCAHPNQENESSDDQPPTNHWSLFLETDTYAIDIDMVPGDPFTNSPGMIILNIIKDFNPTDEYVHDVVHDVQPPETTVASVLQLIIDQRRDRYMFDPIGEGCRFWHSTVAMDMAAAGLISYDAAGEACSAIRRYWFFPPNSGSELRAMKQGTFF